MPPAAFDAPDVPSTDPAAPSLPLPRWIAAIDVLAALALVVALAVAIGGGFRIRVAGLRLAVTSALTPFLISLLLVGARHIVHARPHIVERYIARLRYAMRTDAWRATWPVFLSTRVAVLVLGVLAVYAIGYPPGEPRVRTSENELLNLPMRWDAGWYHQIARVGYYWDRQTTRQQNIAFFPAYPMATRLLARLFGGSGQSYIVAGVVVSHAAFLWALLLLYQLARATLTDEAAATSAVLLAACYPFSLFYGAVYTESLFLLCTLGAWLAFTRRNWGPAMVWGVVAGLTRPNGFLLAVPLAIMAAQSMRRRDDGRGWLAPAAAVLAPVAGMGIFSIYIAALTGDPFAWSAQHAAWGRTFTGVGPLVDSAVTATDSGFWTFVTTRPHDALNGAAALLLAASIIPVGRRLGWACAALIVVTLLPPLLLGGLLSMGRITSTLFPLFLWLAAAAPRWSTPIAATFAMLQGLLAVLFYTWRPPY